MKKLSPGAVFSLVLLALFLANWAWVSVGFKPYLYCGFKDMIWRMYQPLQLLISLAGVLGLFWFGLRRNFGLAALSVCAIVLTYVAPDWVGILFSLGKGCT